MNVQTMEIGLSDLYAGLSGLELSGQSYDLGEGITIRSTYAHLFAPFMAAFVRPEPGKHHPTPWKAARGGFAFDITAELVIPREVERSFKKSFAIARTLVFLLKLEVNPAVMMPLFSNHSFSDMQFDKDDKTMLQPYEVQPRYFPLSIDRGNTTDEEMAWVRDHWQVTQRLMDSSSEFTLAVDALNTGQFIQNTALTLVLLWAALEALFSPSTTELKFRISSLIAAFLQPPGKGRENRQKDISMLYDKRSAAAHGKPKHLPDHLLQSFSLLREVVYKIIDRGSVPTKDELNSMLFGSE